jgi:KaiC/GvpD/RAD55 family RecA-like ATPase
MDVEEQLLQSEPEKRIRVPTGISSLDPVLDGGVPPGSMILLVGDIGGGSVEFVYTSLMALSSHRDEQGSPGILRPKEIRYITFTKQPLNIITEIQESFSPELAIGLSSLIFEDFSKLYFDSSVVPPDWYSKGDVLSRMTRRSERETVLAQLASAINRTNGPALLVMDSITEIGLQCVVQDQWPALTGLLRGFERYSKEKGITSYLLLSRGILDPQRELELADTADAVFHFRWEESTAARRQRVMFVEKFRGVLPHLEDKELVKFSVKISTGHGFEVSNIRVVV